jgi:hypothetical protein
MDPKRALAMAPCMDLDVYVFAKILEGPEDMLEPSRMPSIPAFSRVFGACHMLLIKAVHEFGPLRVDMNPAYFGAAIACGFMIRKTPCPVWKISNQGCSVIGYGRSFEEALCKMFIYHKMCPGKGK